MKWNTFLFVTITFSPSLYAPERPDPFGPDNYDVIDMELTDTEDGEILVYETDEEEMDQPQQNIVYGEPAFIPETPPASDDEDENWPDQAARAA